jgi:hypothetical protein
MQVIAITQKKDAARIGNNFAQSTWYSLTKVPTVELKKGDIVELKFEKEGTTNVITEIKVTGSAPQTIPPSSTDSNGKSEWRSKSPQESESIRKQAVGKMVAETVKAITGLTADNIEKTISQLFNIYDNLTK